jgi:hypothetical protein
MVSFISSRRRIRAPRQPDNKAAVLAQFGQVLVLDLFKSDSNQRPKQGIATGPYDVCEARPDRALTTVHKTRIALEENIVDSGRHTTLHASVETGASILAKPIARQT